MSSSAPKRPRRVTTPNSPESPSQLLPSIQKLFDAQLTQINERFGSMERKIEQQVKNMETKLEEITASLNFQTEQTEKLQRELPQLERKVQDEKEELQEEIDRLSMYVSRENVVFLGIPQLAEKENVIDVLKDFYQTKLKLTTQEIEGIEYQRVHRVPSATKPRPIKARFFRFRDKLLVQGKASNLKGTSMYIVDDLPHRIRMERQQQMPALKAARRIGKLAFFSRSEPAKLLIDRKHLRKEDQKRFLERADGILAEQQKSSENNAMDTGEQGHRRGRGSMSHGEMDSPTQTARGREADGAVGGARPKQWNHGATNGATSSSRFRSF